MEEPDPSSGVFAQFMGWADEFRGQFGVRANADIPRDAKVARKFGAEGRPTAAEKPAPRKSANLSLAVRIREVES